MQVCWQTQAAESVSTFFPAKFVKTSRFKTREAGFPPSCNQVFLHNVFFTQHFPPNALSRRSFEWKTTKRVFACLNAPATNFLGIRKSQTKPFAAIARFPSKRSYLAQFFAFLANFLFHIFFAEFAFTPFLGTTFSPKHLLTSLLTMYTINKEIRFKNCRVKLFLDHMVRVSDRCYKELLKTAGRLQQRLKRSVSLSEAAEYLSSKTEKSARHFWSKVKVKKRAGRGRKKKFLGTTIASAPVYFLPLVHTYKNHRREVH